MIYAVFFACVVLAVLICIALVLMVTYYLHHGFSSGNWFNDKGDALIIRNRGVMGKSEMVIAEQNGDKYNVLKYKCRMLVNPFSLPHKYTMYVFDETPLKAKIDMLTGKLKLYSGDTYYGSFSKSNL